MKTTVKIKGLLLLALSIFFTANVNAQDPGTASPSPENYDQGFKLGFGLSGGYMFDNPYDASLGGDVRLQYDFSKRTSISLTSGFTNLFIGDDLDDLGFIPVKAGFKVFFWEDEFYAGAEIGMGFPVTNDYSDVVDNTVILSPSLGYATKYIDFSLRYEHYTEFPTADGDKGTGQLALRLAYGFKL
ncbi:MAG TPA: hypothetical protein VK623_10425 [Flavobacterium sp.]|nr:hypothetical protein [Flavobacterium sp.]